MTRYTPLWLQQGQYAGSLDRRLLGALWPVAGSTGLAVAPQGGNMSVTIQPGYCAAPTQNSTGTTLCYSDAVEIVTCSTAPGAGLSRIDVVVCQPRANDIDGGANNDFIFAVITGTAVASPSPPAVPAGQVALAQILIGSSVTSIVAGNITDRRPGSISPGVLNVPAGRQYQGAPQTLSTTGFQVLTLGSNDQMKGGMQPYNVAGVGGLIVPVPGTYHVCGCVQYATPSVAMNVDIGIYRSGAQVRTGSSAINITPAGGPGSVCVIADDLNCVAGDYLQLAGYNSAGTIQIQSTGSPTVNYLSAHLVSAP